MTTTTNKLNTCQWFILIYTFLVFAVVRLFETFVLVVRMHVVLVPPGQVRCLIQNLLAHGLFGWRFVLLCRSGRCAGGVRQNG
jgi:hypothetical protein